MIHFVNTHGIEVVIIYYVISAIFSTMPALPDSAGYFQKWAYMAIHVLSGNLSKIAQAYKVDTSNAPAITPENKAP